PKQIERLNSIFENIQQNNGLNSEIDFSPLYLSLHEGFIDRDEKLTCYTDHQIFDRYHRFYLKDRFSKKESVTLKEIHDLKPGDYVTHIDHGVGQFGGLEKIENNGKQQEAIRLIYKDDDLLYISIHSLHQIAKFVSKEGTVPKLSKLGSNAWEKLKNKTKKKVKDIAKDLIKLYAQRKSVKGIQCYPDTYLQHELEASFIYEDTPDQLKATVDVKSDLEKSYPMDRLICGDVGFGKTEIAIRAAFKVVSESKQVALLVPTTILALQHYNTFSERLHEFPVKVDYINRFKSQKQQKQTLKNLKEGKIDILIGTHRIVSKDVEFKDIGLLIIDEEQKFGVSLKEKLKQFKVNIDTLTLTATPIPRTLQFSLMGARDLSIINTPPPNRYPVNTELRAFSEDVIHDGIMYEIARGGQVFFVHNRVKNILDVQQMINRFAPGVKVAVAHGQMEGHKLERIMIDFINGDYDVLLATTIIESGLDIPNVNTIFINEAQNYGLSDLHQLRGRVGRSNKKAFCYLITPPLSTLTTEARKRLKAIEEFSDLGSGFNIAMRDLDIRGAGNILGAEQSGFIAEIGFDTYHKILDEAILELKENEFKDIFGDDNKEKIKEFVKDCIIETDFEVLIPDEYISNITERLSLYKELDNIESEDKLNEFKEKLNDRFGTVPLQTLELINTIKLRWLAKKIGFEKIFLKNKRFTGYFISNQESAYYQSPDFSSVLRFVQNNPDNCKMREYKNKLILGFENIISIDDALRVLEDVTIESKIVE
ncbi:MAG: transcription-repair coupling factor, partial [Bacteroidales bacterium]|nr:transcription-repair coupling factor [Bacteroidales bacterium]